MNSTDNINCTKKKNNDNKQYNKQYNSCYILIAMTIVNREI